MATDGEGDDGMCGQCVQMPVRRERRVRAQEKREGVNVLMASGSKRQDASGEHNQRRFKKRGRGWQCSRSII